MMAVLISVFLALILRILCWGLLGLILRSIYWACCTAGIDSADLSLGLFCWGCSATGLDYTEHLLGMIRPSYMIICCV